MNGRIEEIQNFCIKDGFIYLVALFVMIFHVFALDVYGLCLTMTLIGLSFVLFDDYRPSFTLMFSAIFIVSTQNSPGYGGEGNINYYSRPQVLIPLIIFGVIMSAGVLYRLIKNRENLKSGKFYMPFLILILYFITAGLFREFYGFSLLLGLFEGVMYLGLYVVLTAYIKDGKEFLYYISTLLIVLCLVVGLQVLYVYALNYFLPYRLPGLMIGERDFGGGWKSRIITGWGVSNVAGEIIIMLLPFVFSKINKGKNVLLYSVLALFSLTMVILTFNRSGMLIGVPVFIFLSVRALVKTDKKKTLCFAYLCYILLGAVLCLTVFRNVIISMVNEFIRSNTFDLSDLEGMSTGRSELWRLSLEYFKGSPIVGEGFWRAYAYSPKDGVSTSGNPMQGLLHNFIFQAIGSGGIIGILLVGAFSYFTLKLFLEKYDGKVECLCFLISYTVISLLDTTYFIPYTVMFFVLVLTAVENQVKLKNSEYKLLRDRK